MANFTERQLELQQKYLDALDAHNLQMEMEAMSSPGVTVGGESGGSPSAPTSDRGTVIKTYGPVSLNNNYCQVPTNSSDKAYPSTVVSPTGGRTALQKVVADWRETNNDKGLMTVNSDHYNFVNSWQNKLDPKMFYYLEKLYYLLAPKLGVKKLTINSAFRPPAYQRQIPGASTYSTHSCGWAVDIGANESTQFVIADAAYAIGFGGIAIGKGFVHVDIGVYSRWDYGGIGFKYISPSQHKG